MANKKAEKDKPIFRIGRLGKTKQLGRTLSHEGVTEILNVIAERPKQYKEIANETGLPNSTLERALKELLAIKVIETNKIYSEKRETHQYDYTTFGRDLMIVIDRYEKMITLSPSQKKITEIENIKHKIFK